MTQRVVAVLGRGIVDPQTPVARADDLGLSRGDGCFETARVLVGSDGIGHIQKLDAHLSRLGRSLAALEIETSIPDCRALVEQAVAAWTVPGEACVKLMVTRGVEGSGVPSVIAMVFAMSPTSIAQRDAGIRVVRLARGTTSSSYDEGGWLLGGVKSLSYALNMAALREAERRDADDAIWISTDGFVLEAPTATVVWAVGDALRTTPVGATGILAGTTMALLFDAAAAAGFDVGPAELASPDLDTVEAVWLVSSGRGVTEVVEVDGKTRPQHPDLTRRLQELTGF